MFDAHTLRRQFPALRGAEPPVFLDGPGGSQVPDRVIRAVSEYLAHTNANTHGLFRTSIESDRVLRAAHEAIADLLNAPSADEIAFGANMTTLTFALSRALSKTLSKDDRVLVTRMDHDANVTPWILAARDAGAEVDITDVRPEDCTLDLADFERKLSARTRIVAITCASNAVGTINDVKSIARAAHSVGAIVFLDAVHFAPHGPIDVVEWEADFLACSVYKFFGPHVGVLWGRRELLEALPCYKVRPVPEIIPDRWMTGTQNHEGIAGATAAVQYLAEIGRTQASDAHRAPFLARGMGGRRLDVHAAMAAIKEYEIVLSRAVLSGLASIAPKRIKVWGISDLARLHQRAPTIAITIEGKTPEEAAVALAARDIYAWNGNMYALALAERLDLERTGGVLRLGFVHYNTQEEVERLMIALEEI
jgi:cysteine desulfurase family protein (TIGR01976 family)